VPQEPNPANPSLTRDKEDLQIFFLAEIPTAGGIDYSGYDPNNPGDWTPADADPNEEATALNKEKESLERQLAELLILAAVNAAKIACLEKELISYGAGDLIPTIKFAADQWTIHRREQERQTEFDAENLTKMRELHALAVAADVTLMIEISNCSSRLLKTSCTFTYYNILPLPRNSLTIPNLPGNAEEEYENEVGVVDSVSLSMSSSNASVTVSSIRRKE
jgi:hypothetical protein